MDFFAGANTASGFVSLFDEVFSESERLYIIKGSCGCGKSTLMRRVAARAEELGFTVDRIFCSGDPRSLDGVILREPGIAFCDGTAPHLMDARYPCVRETIVNLGEFHVPEKLMPRREEIIALTNEKASRYAAAYSSIAASKKLLDSARSAVSRSIDVRAISEFAARVASKHSPRNGAQKRVFTSAFTKDGVVTLPSFRRADAFFRVAGPRFAAEYFLKELAAASFEGGLECVVSLAPTDKDFADAVFFPQSGALFALSEEPPCLEYSRKRAVNVSRFVNPDPAARSRARLLERIAASALSAASEELAAASSIHAALERIYVSGTDFDSLDRYAEKLISRVFAS